MDNLQSGPNPVMPQSPPKPSVIQTPQRTWMIVFGLVLVAALVAGGVWAYTTYFTVPPEIKIKQAIEKTAQTNFAYEGMISVTSTRASEYDHYINLAMPVASDTTTKNFVVTFSGAQENIGTENEAWSFSFLAASPDKKGLAVGLDIRSIAKKMYAKLASETRIGFFSLDEYKNMWVKIDLGQYASMLEVGAPATSSASKETLDDIRYKKLKEMAQNANLFTVNSVSTKKIENVSVAAYAVTLNKENLKQLVIDMAIFDNKPLSQKEIDSINESLAEIKDISGEIMIGKKDGLVHVFNLYITSTKDEQASVHIMLKDFNKPIQLTAPENAIPVEELIGQFFAGMGASSSMLSPGTSSFQFDYPMDDDSSVDLYEDEKGYDFAKPEKVTTTRSL